MVMLYEAMFAVLFATGLTKKTTAITGFIQPDCIHTLVAVLADPDPCDGRQVQRQSLTLSL